MFSTKQHNKNSKKVLACTKVAFTLVIGRGTIISLETLARVKNQSKLFRITSSSLLEYSSLNL